MTFKLRTINSDDEKLWLHPLIIASFDGVDFESQRYCGYSHCDGSCGFPALVFTYQGEELKTHSSMVACGPVFQRFRKPWKGKKVFLPEYAGDPEVLIKMYWW